MEEAYLGWKIRPLQCNEPRAVTILQSHQRPLNPDSKPFAQKFGLSRCGDGFLSTPGACMCHETVQQLLAEQLGLLVDM